MIIRSLKVIQEMLDEKGLSTSFENLLVEGVSIDSRSVKKGNLFIPIVRLKDGHQYVREAIKMGAIASLWEKKHPNPPDDIPLIFVDDTLVALQSLASSYRKQLRIKVIGITGSNGKTTTKDMVNAIASTSYKVHKTQGNLNSQIGLPLTILEISENDEVVVLEMGMSERGQIKKLSKIANPDIAIITMIGLSHLATLGSREEIAKAKLEIVEGLKEDGLLIYNGDDQLLQKVKKNENERRIRFISFGEKEENDFFPCSIYADSEEINFIVNHKSSPTYTIALMGKHNIQNALASIAVGKELGIKEGNIVKGLKSLNITEMRMQKIISSRGFTVINDTWNASPNSVQAAIETLQELSGYEKKILVLGDMLELGEREEVYHKNIGRLINSSKIDFLITYGPLAQFISDEAKKTFSVERVKTFTDKEQIVNEIIKIANPKDILLVKGSRGTAMEEVVNKLL